VRGAYHLYEAAVRAGVKKFVFISSLTIVLGRPEYERIGADSPPRPNSFYAASKLFGENLGYVYATQHGIPVLCLRLGQPYPIQHPEEAEYLATPRIRGLLVALEDIARAVECALRAPQPNFGVYSIVSDSDTNWIDFAPAAEIGYAPQYYFTPDGCAPRE